MYFLSGVKFPSGVNLEPVDESSLDSTTAALVEDPLNTGYTNNDHF